MNQEKIAKYGRNLAESITQDWITKHAYQGMEQFDIRINNGSSEYIQEAVRVLREQGWCVNHSTSDMKRFVVSPLSDINLGDLSPVVVKEQALAKRDQYMQGKLKSAFLDFVSASAYQTGTVHRINLGGCYRFLSDLTIARLQENGWCTELVRQGGSGVDTIIRMQPEILVSISEFSPAQALEQARQKRADYIHGKVKSAFLDFVTKSAYRGGLLHEINLGGCYWGLSNDTIDALRSYGWTIDVVQQGGSGVDSIIAMHAASLNEAGEFSPLMALEQARQKRSAYVEAKAKSAFDDFVTKSAYKGGLVHEINLGGCYWGLANDAIKYLRQSGWTVNVTSKGGSGVDTIVSLQPAIYSVQGQYSPSVAVPLSQQKHGNYVADLVQRTLATLHAASNTGLRKKLVSLSGCFPYLSLSALQVICNFGYGYEVKQLRDERHRETLVNFTIPALPLG